MEAKEEEKIINIRIDPDDLLQIFGWLTIAMKGIALPKEFTEDIIYEVIQRITTLNIKNKEYLEVFENKK